MTKKKNSLKLNFIMNIILTMSNFIFPLITFPYVSRILLPNGIGKVSFATSLISYFLMFAQLGIPAYGVRACAKVRDDKEKLSRTAHELLIINLVMSVISYFTLFILIMFVPKLQSEKFLYFIISFSILLNAIGMEWLYKGLEQYSYITIRSIIFKFIAVILMFMFVHSEKDYLIYGGISIFAASASYIFNFINIKKHIFIKPVGNYNFKRHFKVIVTFFAMSCATTVYTHLDTVMLGFMTNDINVGYYNAAVKIKSILVSIITSLGAVLLPRSAYYVENGNMKEFKKISEKALEFVFLLSIPLMIYFTIFAQEGIIFLSGKEYCNAILPMQIIMPTLLFIGITNILGMQILVPLGKEKIVLYSEIAGAIANLILNTLLIPKYGPTGAAIGTLVAELIVLIVQYLYLHKEIQGVFKKINYFKICIAVLIACIISIFIKQFEFNAFLMLLCSATVFFGIYFILLLITKESLITDIINQIITKTKRSS